MVRRPKIDEYIPSRISRWIRDAIPKHYEDLPLLSTEERINILRERYDRSQYADFDQSIKLVQFATEDVLPEDAKPPLYRSLHKLAIQLALDNRFFFDFPEFPDTSLTEYEITQAKDRMRELTFELDHEDAFRRDFLEQLKMILNGFYEFYPKTSGNLSVPLHGLIDTPVFVEALLHTILLTLPKLSPYPFFYTYAQIQRNYDATKQVHPVYSGLSSDEIITTYLAGTPFVEFLSQTCPFEIPDKVRPEHIMIVAQTGFGKSQFIQQDVYHQLKKKERPGIVIVDSQGTMLPKIEAMDVWRDDLVVINPEDVCPPALNMFALPERIKTYDRNTQEIIESTTIQLFGFLFAALDQSLTGRQSTFFSFITRLVLSIPGATIRTLREVLEEEVPEKKPQQSQFWPYVEKLDEDAKSFFTQQFYAKGYNTETKRGIVQRLYGILRVPAFNRMFTARDNRLDLFRELNAGRTILVNTSKSLLGNDASSVFGRYVIAQTLSAVFQRIAIKPPYRSALLYVDEAAEYFSDTTFADLLTQARKYNLGALIAFQNLDQLPANLRPVVISNTSTKLVAGLSHKDAVALSHEMRHSAEWLMSMKKHEDHSEFACYIQNVTPQAVCVSIPFGTVEKAPPMSKEKHEALLQRNRERYGTSSSANVNQESSLSQTHKAPAKEAPREVSRQHPTAVNTTPPSAPNPATDPHAGIDD